MNVNHLGWWIAGYLVAGSVLGRAQAWFLNRWEITFEHRRPRGPFRVRIGRRWYGNGAHVRLKSGGRNPAEPDRFLVIAWMAAAAEPPCLLVRNLDFAGYADLGPPGASWYPVTMFTPYTVPRLRPHFEKYGRRPVFFLRDYIPLRQPSGHLEDVRDAA